MTRSTTSFLILFIFFIATAVPGFSGHNKLGDFHGWHVGYLDNQAAYALSKPIKSEGKYTKRGNVLCIVTAWKDGTDTMHFELGYPVKSGSFVKVIFLDKNKKPHKNFDFIAHGEDAWAPANADKEVIALTKKSSSIVIEAVSSRGTQTKDTFNLLGSTKAIDTALNYRDTKMMGKKQSHKPEPAKTETKKEAPKKEKEPATTFGKISVQTINATDVATTIKPDKSEGKYSKRDPAQLVLTHNKDGKNKAHLVQGYTVKPGSKVTATFYNSKKKSMGKITFNAKDDKAHADASVFNELINFLKKASSFVVEGTSSKETKTKDTYSLSGSSKALNTAQQKLGALKKPAATPVKKAAEPAKKSTPAKKAEPTKKKTEQKTSAPAKKTTTAKKEPAKPTPKKTDSKPPVVNKRAPVK